MEFKSRSLLDRDITLINDMTQQLTSMVLEALQQAMNSLIQWNPQLAQQVIANDEKVNQLRYELEEECVRTLATQQPAAIDLRIVLAATHIAGELERIGDHAASIAEVVARMEGQEPLDSLHKLPKMAKHARRMVEDSIQAFIHRDQEMAYDVSRREDKLDKHYSNLFYDTLHKMHDPAFIERGTFILWVGRHLERVGDRATNIVERVIFLTTGEFIEIQ